MVIKKDGRRERFDRETWITLAQIYEKAKPLWRKVHTLRNNAFGHRSKAHTVAEVFAAARVTPDDLKSLVARELLNAATLALNGSTHAFNLSSHSTTLRLLRALKQDHRLNPSSERARSGPPV